VETRTSGSEDGLRKRTGRKTDTAPQPDPYVWRGQAEHLAELEADEVGASLKWATAKVERTSQRGNGDRSSGWERPAERGGEFNDTPPY
jgi:hypothetical protein